MATFGLARGRVTRLRAGPGGGLATVERVLATVYFFTYYAIGLQQWVPARINRYMII